MNTEGLAYILPFRSRRTLATCLGCSHRQALRSFLGTFVNNTVPAAILGLQGFFPLKGQAAVGVGSIETPLAERKRLAALYVVLYFFIQFV